MNNFRVLWIMLKKMKSLEQPSGTMWKDLSLVVRSSKKDCTRRTRFRIPSGISWNRHSRMFFQPVSFILSFSYERSKVRCTKRICDVEEKTKDERSWFAELSTWFIQMSTSTFSVQWWILDGTQALLMHCTIWNSYCALCHVKVYINDPLFSSPHTFKISTAFSDCEAGEISARRRT